MSLHSQVVKLMRSIKRTGYLGYDPNGCTACVGNKFNLRGDHITYVMEAGFVVKTADRHPTVVRYVKWAITSDGLEFANNPPDELPELYGEPEEDDSWEKDLDKDTVKQVKSVNPDLSDGYVHPPGEDRDYEVEQAFAETFIRLCKQNGVDEAVYKVEDMFVVVTRSKEVTDLASNLNADTMFLPSGKGPKLSENVPPVPSAVNSPNPPLISQSLATTDVARSESQQSNQQTPPPFASK